MATINYCSGAHNAMDRLEQLLGFLEEDPNDEFTLFAIATEYRRKGESDKSLAYFEKLVDLKPEYVGTYYHLAAVYLEMGQRERALATYRAGIRVAERQRDAHARAELQSALMDVEFESGP